MISALFIETNGIYYNDPRIDPWDIERDARLFKGNNKVIAHPPCKRWGRYWSGGPMLAKTPRALKKGDDDNCFAHSLWAVRTFGGVIEHPEASHAWPWFGLNKPPQSGGWVKADDFGGFTCCVAQGHYGHRAQKFTWLYAVNTKLPELIWGKCKGIRMELGPHSKEKAKAIRSCKDYKPIKRISAEERMGTPKDFKELLIERLTT
jgi:hypothetical protein